MECLLSQVGGVKGCGDAKLSFTFAVDCCPTLCQAHRFQLLLQMGNFLEPFCCCLQHPHLHLHHRIGTACTLDGSMHAASHKQRKPKSCCCPSS